MHTPGDEDYVKVIYMLQQSETPVETCHVAERLGLSAAAVTAPHDLFDVGRRSGLEQPMMF